MKVSYYPGCSLENSAREYDASFKAVAGTLGIDLEELSGWTCCGAASAHVADDGLAFSLAARNLVIADRMGMDLVVPCSSCYNRLKNAERELKSVKPAAGNPGHYSNRIGITHSADFIWAACGEKGIQEKVKKPLGGLNPVCYYGCLAVRPPEVTDAEVPEDPQAMDNIMASLGADVKNWSYKTDCCGGDLMLTHPELVNKLVKKLLDMAEEAGANCIVVGCPMCHTNLDTTQREILRDDGSKYDLPVYYFPELMGLAFADASIDKWLNGHMTDARTLLRQHRLL